VSAAARGTILAGALQAVSLERAATDWRERCSRSSAQFWITQSELARSEAVTRGHRFVSSILSTGVHRKGACSEDDDDSREECQQQPAGGSISELTGNARGMPFGAFAHDLLLSPSLAL
jgi:hypothetical protein